MRTAVLLAASTLLLCSCASSPSIPDYISTQHPQIRGVVENWQESAPPYTATLSMWRQEIKGSNYALMQLTADLDTYRFALSREQVELILDAINNFQSISARAASSGSSGTGWLARTGIKLKRLGDDAKDEKLIINIQRGDAGSASLVLTFESWLLTFGGPASPAERTYKQVVFDQQDVAGFRSTLEQIYGQL